MSDARIASFEDYFSKEAPLSPYDEIRKKNVQLIELADRLTESENSYKQLTDTLPYIVFSVSKADKIYLTNKSAANILGDNAREFTPAVIQQLFHALDVEPVTKVWAKAKVKKAVQTVQGRLMVKGEALWQQVYIVPNTDEKENSAGWIISMVDIHAQKRIEETLKDNRELKEAQEKLRQYNEELERKNKEFEQFAYIASHDLQEPLRKIRNFISLSQHNRKDEEKQDFYFSKINVAAERMSHLIKDVLGYSKLSAEPELSVNTDLNQVLQEVQSDFEFVIKETGAVIETESLPTVLGSPIQLSQLFYNLISNSLKFNENEPLIKISYVTEYLDSVPYHKITFEDNGIGIAPQYIDQVFTIFKRLHPQTEYPGTGIGLALCKKIVENHLGKIEIDSKCINGTAIHIYLPH